MSASRLLRRAAAVVGLALAAAAPAAAQTVTVSYAPGCGPGTLCSTARFGILNTTGAQLAFNTLTLTSTGAPFLFDAGVAGTATDSFGAFGVFPTVTVGGTRLDVDFLADAGFLFELAPGAAGTIDFDLAAGASALPAGAFSFGAQVTGPQGQFGVDGVVATVPEPGTLALTVGGLALVGGLAARRRHAA